MYVADSIGYRVRAINMATRQTSTLAGTGVTGNVDGGPGTCTLQYPYGKQPFLLSVFLPVTHL